MNNNGKWSKEKVLKSPLLEKKELVDRNLNNYLVLRLEGLDGIFVFHSHVKEELWGDLVEGQEYTFTIAEDKKGYWNLLDFS